MKGTINGEFARTGGTICTFWLLEFVITWIAYLDRLCRLSRTSYPIFVFDFAFPLIDWSLYILESLFNYFLFPKMLFLRWSLADCRSFSSDVMLITPNELIGKIDGVVCFAEGASIGSSFGTIVCGFCGWKRDCCFGFSSLFSLSLATGLSSSYYRGLVVGALICLKSCLYYITLGDL